MRKYYTRPCNFYYGNCAKNLIKNKKALSLAGNPNIAFDRLEIFERKKRKITHSKRYSINEIRTLNKEIKDLIFNNTQPKRAKDEEEQDDKESSAIGSLGLKPKPAV